MADEFKRIAKQCQRVLEEMDKSEASFVALKDLDSSQTSAFDGILNELREARLRVRRAHTLFNALPDAVNEINHAMLLLDRAKDFIDTIRQRKNDTDRI